MIAAMIPGCHQKGLLSSVLVWFTLWQSLMWGAYAHIAAWHQGAYHLCLLQNILGVH